MGRISTKLIKRKARKFVEKHGDAFGTDFEKNKQALEELTEFSSKKIRNRIAGQIVRLKKRPEK